MSESEEMYLVSIARINEAGMESPVPLSQLAGVLDVQPVSANQMVHKLEQAGLVCYTPYKGVELTQEGQKRAAQILRFRRLWEVFLVEHLGFAVPDADALACRLEHILPPKAAERLADFLGHPLLSPQGEPIPSPASAYTADSAISLSLCSVGEGYTVARIQGDSGARAFLLSQGIQAGTILNLLAIGADGAVLVATRENNSVHLSSAVAHTIWVKK